jgi:hypothetical protein
LILLQKQEGDTNNSKKKSPKKLQSPSWTSKTAQSEYVHSPLSGVRRTSPKRQKEKVKFASTQ